MPADAEMLLTNLLREDGNNGWFDFALSHSWSRSSLRMLERAILPGIIVHFLVRKRWIERAVTAAIDGGCNQLVVIGAGLDTLALRLHRLRPNVSFWELDHPASQRPKVEVLKSLSPMGNLLLAPIDLRNELPSEVLSRNMHFNRQGRTCFVAEGLLMYLPEARVIQVMQDIAQYVDSEIIFTFMEPNPGGQAAFRGGSSAIEKWLRWRSEPFAWAISRAMIADFVAPIGFGVRIIVGADELRAEFLASAGLASTALAEGECLGLLTSIR